LCKRHKNIVGDIQESLNDFLDGEN